jgi:hypothetical protein
MLAPGRKADMRTIAIALLITLNLSGLTAQAPQKKKPAPAPAKQAGQQKLTPAQMADMKKKMTAGMEKAKAEMKAKVQEKLAQAQLEDIKRRHKSFTDLLPVAEPGARAAIQAHIAKLQSAIDEQSKIKVPIALEKYFPKSTLGARKAEVFQKQSAAAQNRPQRREERKSTPGSQQNATAAGPNITKIIVNGKPGSSGQPGDSVMIEGTGFGSNPTVYFLVANGNSQMATLNPIYTGNKSIVATVPEVTGIPKYIGSVAVSTANGNDNAPFTFLPIIATQPIAITMANVQWSDPNCPTNGASASSGEWECAIVTYQQISNVPNTAAKQFLSFNPPQGPNSPITLTSADVFFKGYKLLNGWVVDSVVFLPYAYPQEPNNTKTTLQGFTAGSGSPQGTIHSSISGPYNASSYYLTIMIHGPQGTNYQ